MTPEEILRAIFKLRLMQEIAGWSDVEWREMTSSVNEFTLTCRVPAVDGDAVFSIVVTHMGPVVV